MTEEEKAVIKTFKEGYGLTNAEREIILNLIQKQDTEINKLNNVIDRLLRDIYECIQNDDNATILSIKDYGDYNTFEQIKDKYKEYFMKEDK